MAILNVELVEIVFAQPLFGGVNKGERSPGGIGCVQAFCILSRGGMGNIKTKLSRATEQFEVIETKIEIVLAEASLVLRSCWGTSLKAALRADLNTSPSRTGVTA
jgi:hypothetical protein